MTHRPRRQPPRLPNSSDRRYTSFKELGVASPRPGESETDDDHDVHNNHNTNPDDHNRKDERSAPTAAQSAKSKGERQSGGAGKKQGTRKEGVKAEEREQGRARSGSMRLVQWIMRRRSASSAP